MTHDEFKKHWNKKHKTVFAAMNRALKEQGFSGKIASFSMTVPKSVTDSIPKRAAAMSAGGSDCCDDCKDASQGCDSSTEQKMPCVCPDGSGRMIVKQCCVPKG